MPQRQLVVGFRQAGELRTAMRIGEMLGQRAAFFRPRLPSLNARIGGSGAIQLETRGEAGHNLCQRSVECGRFQEPPALVFVARLYGAMLEISGSIGKTGSCHATVW